MRFLHTPKSLPSNPHDHVAESPTVARRIPRKTFCPSLQALCLRHENEPPYSQPTWKPLTRLPPPICGRCHPCHVNMDSMEARQWIDEGTSLPLVLHITCPGCGRGAYSVFFNAGRGRRQQSRLLTFLRSSARSPLCLSPLLPGARGRCARHDTVGWEGRDVHHTVGWGGLDVTACSPILSLGSSHN